MKICYTLLLFLVPNILGAQETNSGKKLWAKSILNQKAPELIVQEWMTQVPDARGKFVLIDFSATWCHACRKSMPELNDYQKKFADKLTIIFITKESVEKVNAANNFLCELSMAIDTLNRSANALAVKGIPHNLLIDPKGYVRWEGFPATRDFELTEDVLLSLFEKYSPAPSDVFSRKIVRKVLPEPHFSGPVKKLVEVNYTPVGKADAVTKGNFLGRKISIFNPEGNLEEEKYFRNGDTLVDFTQISFNHIGKALKNTTYDSTAQLYVTTHYTYDKKGRLTGELVTDAAGNTDCKSAYRYNNKGQLTEENLWDGNGKIIYRTVYRYKKQRLADKTIYDDLGRVSSRFVATYDSGGRPVESASYGKSQLNNLYRYTYNKKGQRIEERVFNSDRKLTSVYRYSFDERGNETDELVCNAAGQEVIQYQYRYEGNQQIETRRTDYGTFYLQSNYAHVPEADQVIWDYWNQGKPSTKYISRFEEKDAYGNWKRRIKLANDRPVAYSEREIEYHQAVAKQQTIN